MSDMFCVFYVLCYRGRDERPFFVANTESTEDTEALRSALYATPNLTNPTNLFSSDH